MTADDICPNCKSKNTSGDDPSYGHQSFEASFQCEDCETTWTAEYKWIKNSNIETAEDFERKIKFHRMRLHAIISTSGIRVPAMRGDEFIEKVLKQLPKGLK